MLKDEQRIKSVLKDFHVKNEKQFYSFINNTWNFCNCTRCNRTINLLYCDFDKGNPICKNSSCII